MTNYEPETDAQRAYRLLAESMKAEDYDSSMLGDYEYEDNYEDDAPSSDYSAGYQDGYRAGMLRNSIKWRIIYAIPWKVRARYYAIRRRLFPKNSDIPF